jgi:hypothetical protein
VVRFNGRTEEGKETGAAASGGTPFKQHCGKQRKGGGIRGSMARRDAWKEGMGGLILTGGGQCGRPGVAWSAQGRRRGL